MTWMVEWWEDDPMTEEIVHNSDSWDKWEDVVRIFIECIEDDLCVKAKVTCFLGDNPYPTDDPVVLEYRL